MSMGLLVPSTVEEEFIEFIDTNLYENTGEYFFTFNIVLVFIEKRSSRQDKSTIYSSMHQILVDFKEH